MLLLYVKSKIKSNKSSREKDNIIKNLNKKINNIKKMPVSRQEDIARALDNDIFISYSSNDSDVMKLLYDDLERNTLSCWSSEVKGQVGVRVNDEIVENIVSLKVFLLLWSENAKNSKYVSGEITAARNINKEIIPVILEKKTPLPVIIMDTSYIDLSDWGRKTPLSENDQFNKLLSGIKVLINKKTKIN